MDTYLTNEQQTQLLKPINPLRVAHAQGLSHLEAWDVRAHLNRILGFARWSADLLNIEMLYEDKTTTRSGTSAWSVGYRATMRLTICAPDGSTLATYTEAAAGGPMPNPSRADCHDMAIKTAESQALKRCATNLGDQFGLSLYDEGRTDAVVLATLLHKSDTGEIEEGSAE